MILRMLFESNIIQYLIIAFSNYFTRILIEERSSSPEYFNSHLAVFGVRRWYALKRNSSQYSKEILSALPVYIITLGTRKWAVPHGISQHIKKMYTMII